jgi:general secretion pathway protein C
MEIYLKRYFWTLPFIMIVACAILVALGVNHVVEAHFLLDDGGARTHHARPVPKLVTQKPLPTKDPQDVIGRNMFCSTCDPPKPVDTAATPAQPVDENHPPLTSLPLALVATIVSANSRLSAATVFNTQTFRSGSYGIGDGIPDAGQVRRVHSRSVDFWNKSSNRLERIDLLGAAGAPVAANTPVQAPVPATIAQPSDPANPDGELLAAVDKGIKKIDETRYDIDRALVDKLLSDPSAVARWARMVPSIKDGKPNGFKMYAIRPNTLFGKLGMQNGDTITAINGFDMSSPDKALEVYTKVRSASSLNVSVIRRGQNMTMDYSIK